MSHIQIDGLMTIGPLTENQNRRKKAFQNLKSFFSILNKAVAPEKQVKELSMGMSNDFGIAVEEGSTQVRIGTALLGRRQNQ